MEENKKFLIKTSVENTSVIINPTIIEFFLDILKRVIRPRLIIKSQMFREHEVLGISVSTLAGQY